MKVEVQCSINSGQHDKGDVMDMPDSQAKTMIQQGLAVKVGGATKTTPAKEPSREIPKRPKKLKE